MDVGLRAELLAMAAAAARARAEASSRVPPGRTVADDPEVRELQARHAERLWDVLDDLEHWPGRSLVGADGAEAAWAIAQHSVYDPELQRRALVHLEVAADLGDADPVHHAYLLDRVCMASGRPQPYGSQVVTGADGRTLEPWLVDDVAAVDVRRARLGLPPLADHLAALRAAHAERTAPR